MNPTVYQVTRGSLIQTVKSFNDALGVARGLFRNLPQTHYVPWERINEKVTQINGDILVEVVNVSLDWVKWCPQLPFGEAGWKA